MKRTGAALIERIPAIFNKVFNGQISPADTVAVKLHFGEPGNNAYVKPQFVKPFVDLITGIGARPFLTDANTLYKGKRGDSKTHLESALAHGFSKETMGAEIRIADGMDGRSIEKVKVNLEHFKEVSIAKAGVDAKCLVAVSHFKGHELTGFGGALKNIGMGFGSRAGKQQMHADVRPEVNIATCDGDGACERSCPTDAIKLIDGKAFIDKGKCIGCAECVALCPTGAIAISWEGDPGSAQEKIAEYAYGVLANKKNKSLFFNFILNVSPNCDCYPFNDSPIVDDIGLVASDDIVAIDQASVDLVNSGSGRIEGQDKFREIYPDVDWSIQLAHAEKIGLGRRQYELIKID